jgi:hypothetical protein
VPVELNAGAEIVCDCACTLKSMPAIKTRQTSGFFSKPATSVETELPIGALFIPIIITLPLF